MIIVTGASRGLGRAIALRLASRGTEVLGLSRRPAEEKEFKTAACDVSSYESVKAVASDLKKRGASVEGLINAAGVAAMNLAVSTPPEIAYKVVNTNLLGTIFSCQLFAPLMIRRQAGVILNFSTIAVALGLKGESIYVASKAGVEGFSRVFAREVAPYGMRVNCIAPGPIDTDLLNGVTEEQIAAITAEQVIQKQFTPDAVCDIVELLLDGRAAAVTGEVIRVGGA